jgi:hypothetical protein
MPYPLSHKLVNVLFLALPQFMRRYWQHNSKIIHGVPKSQLLVVNLYNQNEQDWDAIAKFIGIAKADIPTFPFPKPTAGSL